MMFGRPRVTGFALAVLLGLAMTPAFGQFGGGSRGKMKPKPRPSAQEEDIWAIRCVTLKGRDRFKLAKNYAGALRRVKGIDAKLVQVLDDEKESSVYYGWYERVYDRGRKKEAFKPSPLKDLELVRSLSMMVEKRGGSRPVWPFQRATMASLPSANRGNARWELSNAKGYYSLQVGVFYNSEGMRQRRYAAEEYCKLLREQGEEAYFDHGVVNSSVCIGAFPKAAIETHQETDPYTGIVQAKAKIVDPRMLELQRKFPHNLHNGARFYDVQQDPRTGEKVRVPHYSFAVEIPRDEEKLEFGSDLPEDW